MDLRSLIERVIVYGIIACWGLVVAIIFGVCVFLVLVALTHPVVWIPLLVAWLISFLVIKPLSSKSENPSIPTDGVAVVPADSLMATKEPEKPFDQLVDIKASQQELPQNDEVLNPARELPVFVPDRVSSHIEEVSNATSPAPISVENTEFSPAVSQTDKAAVLKERENQEGPSSDKEEHDTEDLKPSGPAIEGQRRLRSRYEPVRDPKLRAAAISIHGRDCCVCGFNFDDFFGERLGSGYVEMHHLKTIAAGERLTDPATDLAPLCANCHAMADRLARLMEPPPDTIDGLKSVLLSHLKARLEPKWPR